VDYIRDNKAGIGAVAILFLSTCLYLPFIDSSRDNRLLLVGIIILIVIAGLLWKYTKTGALLLGWVAIRFYFGTSEWMGTPIYSILCLSILCLAGLWTYPKWGNIKNTICLIALFNVAFEVLQLYGIQWPLPFQVDMSSFQRGTCGLTGNPNEVSALLGMSIAMFFRKRWAYCIPFVVLGLILAQSLVGCVSAAAVFVMWSITKYDRSDAYDSLRRVVVVLCACVLLAAYAIKIDRLNIPEQVQHRGMVYLTTVKVASVKAFGWGFGQYQYVMPLFTFSGSSPAYYIDHLLSNVSDKEALEKGIKRVAGTTDIAKAREYFKNHTTPAPFDKAHNEYIEFYFATGIIGAVLGFLFMVSMLRRGFKNKDKLPVLCLMASGLSALVFFPWQVTQTAVMTISFIVMIVGGSKE